MSLPTGFPGTIDNAVWQPFVFPRDANPPPEQSSNTNSHAPAKTGGPNPVVLPRALPPERSSNVTNLHSPAETKGHPFVFPSATTLPPEHPSNVTNSPAHRAPAQTKGYPFVFPGATTLPPEHPSSANPCVPVETGGERVHFANLNSFPKGSGDFEGLPAPWNKKKQFDFTFKMAPDLFTSLSGPQRDREVEERGADKRLQLARTTRDVAVAQVKYRWARIAEIDAMGDIARDECQEAVTRLERAEKHVKVMQEELGTIKQQNIPSIRVPLSHEILQSLDPSSHQDEEMSDSNSYYNSASPTPTPSDV